MKYLAFLLTFLLVFFMVPLPAQAQECQSTALGVVCLGVDGGRAVVTGLGGLVYLEAQVEPEVVQLPPVTIPGPTETVTLPPPPPVTTTETTTITETETVTEPGPTNDVGQESSMESSSESQDRPVEDVGRSAEPTLAEPPRDDGLDIIPDDPGAAAFTGGIVGLLLGVLLGILGLYLAYRHGRAKGEKATLQEFFTIIRSR